jgi:hypothetical protein
VDVDRLVKNALTGLYERIRVLASEGSLTTAKDFAEREPLAVLPLHVVPVRTSTLVVNQYRFSNATLPIEQVADVAELLLNRKQVSLF